MITEPLSAEVSEPGQQRSFAPRSARAHRHRFTVVILALSACSVFATTNVIQTNDPLCAVPAPGHFKQGPGTLRMVARLQQIYKSIDPRDTIYLNREIVPLLQHALTSATNVQGELSLRVEIASQMLCAGENMEAIEAFNALPQFIREKHLRLNSQNVAYLQLQSALAYMRLGEQENCLLNHTSDSCLFPIQAGGVHQLPRGSRGAITVLNKMLARNSRDLDARWLLNIAFMTLGEYPDHVPQAFLIPPGRFASEYNLPRFPEAAAAAGVDVEGHAGGCIAEDFDGDGLLDIMASSWSMTGQLRFFHNNGDGTFADRTAEAGLLGLTGALNIMQTDYNNDGYPDVFMLRGAWMGKAGHQPNSLLRNNGDGTFEDVTEEAGLLSFHPTQTATWFDFDGDGWLDVFIGNETYEAEKHPCELYHNNGNGTFTECAAASGIAAMGFIKGVASGDYDNDGRPDLYLSSREQPNLLMHNDGPAPGHSREHPAWRFSDATTLAGVEQPVASFPTWFFDYDNDGRLDIFVTGYAATVGEIAADYLGLPHNGARARLYHNEGGGKFTDVTKRVGLYKILHAMGANFGDLDNDGWLDFYLGTGDPDFATLIPNRAFRNDGGKRFQDVTTAGDLGHLQKGHGIAFADFDNDGDQDIYTVMGGAFSGDVYRNALFVNPGNSNHWITLKLEGTKSNRVAIGARIRVIVETATGERSIYKTVCSGGSFGASPLRQEIGLGAAKRIRAVEIFWPVTGKTQTLRELQMDRFYRIREESDQAELWNLKQFHLATTVDPSRHAGHEHPHVLPPLPGS